MNDQTPPAQALTPRLPNGAGAAALLAAGLGAATLAVLSIVADHVPAIRSAMIFYTPTGPLSGVTTTAVAVWLLCWLLLDLAWKRRSLGHWPILAGLGLLALGFILTFPPLGDLF